jgi:hypothetical protein
MRSFIILLENEDYISARACSLLHRYEFEVFHVVDSQSGFGAHKPLAPSQ